MMIMVVCAGDGGEASAGVPVDRDSQAHSAAGLVVPDLELEGVEQLSLEVFR